MSEYHKYKNDNEECSSDESHYEGENGLRIRRVGSNYEENIYSGADVSQEDVNLGFSSDDKSCLSSIKTDNYEDRSDFDILDMFNRLENAIDSDLENSPTNSRHDDDGSAVEIPLRVGESDSELTYVETYEDIKEDHEVSPDKPPSRFRRVTELDLAQQNLFADGDISSDEERPSSVISGRGQDNVPAQEMQRDGDNGQEDNGQEDNCQKKDVLCWIFCCPLKLCNEIGKRF